MGKGKGELVSVQPEMLRYVDNADLSEWDYDALVEAGRGIGEVKTYVNWLYGKLGDAVSSKYGDLTKYAKDINQHYGSLQQYVNTYRKYTRDDPDFTPDKYFGLVPWGMLQLVATKGDKPIKLLNTLVDKGVKTIEHAYREIKSKETGKSVPKKPKVSLKFDEEGDKWKIDISPEDMLLIDWSDIGEKLMEYLKSFL